ncbi:inactive receptor-like serine/threonine-protein kinase At2g40270 [Cajanus cajan]|uniref:LRR receptor-like serine/threonine-protein kinase MRH1 n=1 Tax=Cajanus cajan TaxID=3821 RepID=A0A151U1E4_CAJCA|nr:inactive receptor-like serine/threonine-protein kinase At2g40270 [Cajanus cajan]KYP73081.1 putative LRR receptor-like serine/threonine-protein kinase MRH1 [Cajanus cajan]
MGKNRKFSRFKDLSMALRFVAVFFLFQDLDLCSSLNEEGNALLKLRQRIVSDPFGALSNWIQDEVSVDPCNWFGVECSDGKVVTLNLKDLCLGGTLGPEIVNLVHIKSIILRNNSFYGTIPEGFVDLKELEVLDLGYNNFSGHLPADLGSNISLAILLLDNNEFLVGFSPEINELRMLSECQVDENQLTNAANMPACPERAITWHIGQGKGTRGLLGNDKSALFPPHPSRVPNPLHSNKKEAFNRAKNPVVESHSPASAPASAKPPVPTKPAPPREKAFHSKTKSTSSNIHILAGVIGGVVFLLISSIGIYLCKTKVANVRPWATGLSGQLQKAFVTGVQKLKRTDLEAACEDFSNVIGTSAVGPLYKGTLSSGVEIAVACVPVTSSKNWSKTLEAQFRKKLDTLSKVNHKNFVNLIGYCEEEEPFTRMLVFEYAPNGTLFEHLHIKEAEHLDWGTRLRVAVGMAYCLQQMHELDPPMALMKLNSSAVYLTDDYAAKLSDLSFSNDTASAETKANDMPIASPESNVYSFGVLLFEMVTGRIPYSVEQRDSLENWASHYLQGDQPLKEMVDPILVSYQEDQLEQVSALIKTCVDPDPEQRPTMKDVSERLREITKITPESAVPKLSPLWWAELEIASSEAR